MNIYVGKSLIALLILVISPLSIIVDSDDGDSKSNSITLINLLKERDLAGKYWVPDVINN